MHFRIVRGNSDMHKHNKYAGGEHEFRQALSILSYCENREKKPDVSISCAEHEHKPTMWICTLENQASFTPQHIWICKCFPAQKALTSCYYVIPVGADTTAWKYIIGGRARERRVALDSCWGDVCTLLACTHLWVLGCLFVCRNVINASGVSLLLARIWDALGHTIMKGLITEGIETFKEINPDHNSAGSQTLCTDRAMLEERIWLRKFISHQMQVKVTSPWWLCLNRDVYKCSTLPTHWWHTNGDIRHCLFHPLQSLQSQLDERVSVGSSKRSSQLRARGSTFVQEDLQDPKHWRAPQKLLIIIILKSWGGFRDCLCTGPKIPCYVPARTCAWYLFVQVLRLIKHHRIQSLRERTLSRRYFKAEVWQLL